MKMKYTLTQQTSTKHMKKERLKRKKHIKKYPPCQRAQSNCPFLKLNIEVNLESQTYQELDIIQVMNLVATEIGHFQKDAQQPSAP